MPQPAEHTLADSAVHHRWNAALPPALTIRSGDTVHFRCRDSSDGQVHPGMTVEAYRQIDRGRIHALTGPVFVEEARPGDVLVVDVLAVRHGGWGWSSIVPGLGFLSDRFREDHLFLWELEERVTRSLAPAVLPLRPFCGILGVAPGDDGEFRTRPPGPFGGNVDVRGLRAGARLYLPVFRPGALFSTGDIHAAQGDGEVCLNGIETPGEVSLRLHVRRDFALSAPMAEAPAPPADEPGLPGEPGEWLVIEADADPLAAARRATSRMVDFLAARWGLRPENAYVLCSAAMSLQLSQVVNVPLVTVTAALPKAILPPVTL